MLEHARRDAENIITDDSKLTKPENSGLQDFLQYSSKDTAWSKIS